MSDASAPPTTAAAAAVASDATILPPTASTSSANGHAPVEASQQAPSSSAVASSSKPTAPPASYGKTSDPPSDAASASGETRSAGAAAAARPSRRVMPARLLRVSSLLVGSKVEDELLGGIEGRVDTSFLPAATSIFLSTSSVPQAYEAQSAETAGLSFFSDPEVARSCRQRELIETPEFSHWDDSEMLGKTRHMKSEEDTSDAAYEKRHRRPDKVEKRQRRLEKELLMRDRQKLKERIEHLKVADTRLLLPIIAARERAENGSSTADADAHSGAMTAKLEQLRSNLLAEAYETLARYDALLPAAPPLSNATELKKRLHPDDDSDSDGARSSPGPAGRGAGASAARRFSTGFRTGAAASPLGTRFSSSKAARPSRASSGSMLMTPKQRIAKARSSAPSGPLITTPEGIRVELGHHNIHARTSGGRFAPKSAVQKLADKAAKEAKRLGLPPPALGTPITVKSGAPVVTVRRSLPARGVSPETGVATLVPGKRGFKIRRDRQPEAGTSSGAASSGRAQGAQARDHARFSGPSIAAEVHAQKVALNKTGPSLAELDAADRRPKRVKLILRGRDGTAATPDPVVPAAAAASSSVAPLTAANIAALEEPEEATVDSAFSMGDGLTFEEAQALMEAAMMGDGEEAAAPDASTSAAAAAAAPAAAPAAPEASSVAAAPVEQQEAAPSAAPEVQEAVANPEPPAAAVPKIETEEQTAAPTPPPAAAPAAPVPVIGTASPTPAPATAPPSATSTPVKSLKPGKSSGGGGSSRRISSRVQNASAFGEKIPEFATRRIDFDLVWSEEVSQAGPLQEVFLARTEVAQPQPQPQIPAAPTKQAEPAARVEAQETTV